MNFCDFCTCEQCMTGEGTEALDICHAPTADGRWICKVCYMYDVCTSGPGRSDHPCDDVSCRHRPRLVGTWRKRNVP